MRKLYLLLLLPLVFACQSNPHEANIAVVKEYVAAVESLDYNAMENLLAENYVGYGPSSGDTIHREAAVETWQRSVEELYNKIHYSRSQ